MEALYAALGLGPDDGLFFAAGKPEQAAKLAGAARTRVAEQLGLIDKDRFELCWIVDFPFYEWDEDAKKVEFAHNPFSMPQGGMDALTGQDPLRNEQKHIQQNGTFIFGGMVLMAGNETLQATDYTSGLGRRMLVIEFDRVIEPKEKRAFLAAGGEDQLHREVPAIINRALELDRDQVAAFFMHPPESIQKSTFDAATDQNPLLGWITSNLLPRAGAKTYVGAKTEGRTEGGITYYVHQDIKLYPNYLLWCKRTGRECVSLHRFSKLALDVLKHTLGLDVIKHRDGAGTYLQGVVIDESLAPDHWGGEL
jgi:hypothetical protein